MLQDSCQSAFSAPEICKHEHANKDNPACGIEPPPWIDHESANDESKHEYACPVKKGGYGELSPPVGSPMGPSHIHLAVRIPF